MTKERTIRWVCRVICVAGTLAVGICDQYPSAHAQPAEGLRGVFNEVGKTPKKPVVQVKPPEIKAPEILPPSQLQKPAGSEPAAQNPVQLNVPQVKLPELKPILVDGSHSRVNSPSLNLPQANTGAWVPAGSFPMQGGPVPSIEGQLGLPGEHNVLEIFKEPPSNPSTLGSISGIFPEFAGNVLGGGGLGGLGAGALGGLGGIGGGLLGGLNPGQLGQLGMLSGLLGSIGQGLFSGLTPGTIAQIGIGAGMMLAQSGQSGQAAQNQAELPTPTPTPRPK